MGGGQCFFHSRKCISNTSSNSLSLMIFPFLVFLFVLDLIAHKSLYPLPPTPPLFPELDQSLGNPCFALLGHRIILRLSTQQLYFAGSLPFYQLNFTFALFTPHIISHHSFLLCVFCFSQTIFFSHFVSSVRSSSVYHGLLEGSTHFFKFFKFFRFESESESERTQHVLYF